MYEDIAINCFRYLGFTSFQQVNNLTLREYNILIKATQYKQVDQDYQQHRQAFLNLQVKGEKRTGKYKTKPVYPYFEKFYNYAEALERVENGGKRKPRFAGIGKLLDRNKEV